MQIIYINILHNYKNRELISMKTMSQRKRNSFSLCKIFFSFDFGLKYDPYMGLAQISSLIMAKLLLMEITHAPFSITLQ